MVAKSSKVEVVIHDDKRMPRPTVNERFPQEFNFAADTPGAPELSEELKINNYSSIINYNFIPRLIADIRLAEKTKSVVCIAAYVINHPHVLESLKNVDALILPQKYFATEETMDLYLSLSCSKRRFEFSGNIIPFLKRRDGQEDYACMDAVRFIGNQHQTTRMLQNETRPYFHPKIVSILTPNDNEILTPKIGYIGSSNISVNSESSFEIMRRTTDLAEVEAIYSVFAHCWSLSEGLYNLSQGLHPTYYWEKKPKFAAQPVCKECGNDRLIPIWTKSFVTDQIERKLKCSQCKQQAPWTQYLEEHLKRRY
jgi:hypothetical protein